LELAVQKLKTPSRLASIERLRALRADLHLGQPGLPDGPLGAPAPWFWEEFNKWTENVRVAILDSFLTDDRGRRDRRSGNAC
jgi:hypothetical protein